MKSSFLAITVVLAALVAMPVMAQEASFGKDIPLEMALRQIVPADATIQITDGVNKAARVTWDGKDGWQKAVTQAASSAGYIAVVKGSTITVSRAGAAVETVAQAPKPASAKPAAPQASKPAQAKPQTAPKPGAQPKPRPVQPVPASRRSTVEQTVISAGGFVFIPEGTPATEAGKGEGWQTYGDKGASAPVPVTAIAKPLAPEWVVRPGEDLYAVLSDWATKGGFTLEWKSEYSYSMTTGARFGGSMPEAIEQLVRSLDTVRPLLTVRIHTGNKVVEVWNGSLGEVN